MIIRVVCSYLVPLESFLELSRALQTPLELTLQNSSLLMLLMVLINEIISKHCDCIYIVLKKKPLIVCNLHLVLICSKFW